MKRFFLFLALGASIFLPSAFACRDPLSETTTLLEALPPLSETRPVVAKIMILAPDKFDKKQALRVKVTRAIKGIKKGAEFGFVAFTSCERNPDAKIGQEFYVSGAFNEAGLFSGGWKQTK